MGPLFAVMLHMASKEPDRDPTQGERFVLTVVALGNALVLAGAIVLAGECLRERAWELVAAVLVPVPYTIVRILSPCVEETPAPGW